MLLYSRDLPGGGVVMISGEQKGPSAYRGYISVERRRDPGRRVGHEPPGDRGGKRRDADIGAQNTLRYRVGQPGNRARHFQVGDAAPPD